MRQRRLDLCRQFVDALDIDRECFARQRAADPKLSDTDLRNLCSALLIAGSDGPSVALQWLIVLLASRPALQDALHTELVSIGGTGPVQATEIDRMPLLRAVEREVLRFRPKSFVGLPHRASRDVAVCDRSGERFTVPEGAAVLVNSFAIDRSVTRYAVEQFPRMYAARPLHEFDPSRFLHVPSTSAALIATSDWKQRDHLAFGVGARTCPGAAFGELQLLLGAASLLKAFRITADQPLDETTMLPHLTNAPASCAVHFNLREQ